jgi:tetratricopeptide (TPR) repeat protein
MENPDSNTKHQEAIKAALSKNWDLAIEINQAILQEDPTDTPALNRLGICFSMVGRSREAKASFNKVLEISPKNQIAKNNLNRLKNNHDTGLLNFQTVSFIEEPGVSKIFALVNPGEPAVLCSINIGDEVVLHICRRKIRVLTQDKQHIGYLPDLISHRLIEFINAGYKYKAVVKSTNLKIPQILIQETFASKKLKGLASFPLDDNDMLPNLSAGDSSETPPIQMFDPDIPSED